MKKICSIVFFATSIIIVFSVSNFAFSGPQREQASAQSVKIEVAQLTIFDDPSLDRRVSEAQRKIDVGKKAGQLTPDEANRLQAILDRINERVTKYRKDGFLTREERNKLNEMLSALEEKIHDERSDDETARRSAFDRRFAELQRRIDAGVRAAQLTSDEARNLQTALKRINERDARYRADGLLTNEEKTSLNQMLNSLEERIRYERNDSDVVHREAFERRISELKKRIETGMRAGQLTLDEACRLNSILIRTKERDTQFRSDGILTRTERVSLNRMLAHLEEQIYEERWDADINNPLFR